MECSYTLYYSVVVVLSGANVRLADFTRDYRVPKSSHSKSKVANSTPHLTVQEGDSAHLTVREGDSAHSAIQEGDSAHSTIQVRGSAQSAALYKTRLCWFYSQHPDGCRLVATECRYAHGDGELRERPSYK